MGNAGVESGRFEEFEGARRRPGRCPGGQAQMGEDLGNHRSIFSGRGDLQGATATIAEFSRIRTCPGLKGQRNHYRKADNRLLGSNGRKGSVAARQRLQARTSSLTVSKRP